MSRTKLKDVCENRLEDRAFWEKMYPGYTLHYCEPIITGNNTRHLIVRLYRKRDWDAAEQEEPALSMRMELSDLPPKYRAQAEAQIAARCRAKAPTLEAVAAAAKKTGREFDSRGEYDYYMGMILPKVQRGEIVKVESHRRFTMLPEKEYGNVKLPAMHYTPDFVLTYADGTVEVVEVKSKFTRRQQRDYIHRRRIFIDLVAEPRGWRFVEHITPDTAAEIKAWKKCAQQTERKG